MKPKATIRSEFLVVGQGIAGTLLAYFFWLKKQPFRVIDYPLPGASSEIAAGIINPVTGRRLVKSWRFNELSAFAKNTYHAFELAFGVKIYEGKNILRALSNVFEENEWDRRSGFPEYQPFFADHADLSDYKPLLKPAYSWGELRKAARVDMPLMMGAFRRFLKEKKRISEEVFDFDQLAFHGDLVYYKGIQFDKIVFCEGAKGKENPYFSNLPFAPSKGEVLLVKATGWNSEKLVKNHIYIAPFKKDVYWVGSTNSFEADQPYPTKEKFEYLKTKLKETINLPFDIIAHHAGIRPTVSDKRPLLGVHPTYSQLYIFNGLGTKGASIAPLFAHQMAEYMINNDPLDNEVDIERFSL